MVSKGVKGLIEILEKEIVQLTADKNLVENEISKRMLENAVQNRQEKLGELKEKYIFY